MKIHGLMLAAGQGARFGGAKQVAQIQGEPLITKSLSALMPHRELLSDLTVVTGAYHKQVRAVLPSEVRVRFVEEWHLGMGHSLAQGVTHLLHDCEAVLICLADQVALTTDDYLRLFCAFAEESNADKPRIVASAYANRVGVPAIFPKEYFSALSELSGDRGARDFIDANMRQVVAVSCPNAVIDIDSAQDLSNYLTRRDVNTE